MTITLLVYVCFWCAMSMVLMRMFVPDVSRWVLVLTGAFLISILGDYALRTRTSDVGFILGIAGYLAAHIGFQIYGWKFITGKKKFSWIVLAIILIPFSIFYFVFLLPSDSLQKNIFLAIAVLIYLLVSCFTLAISIDIKSGRKPSWTWIYAIGILCLLASDTLLALRHFVGHRTLNDLYMLPLFYTSYVFVAVSILIKHLPNFALINSKDQE